MQDLPHKLDVLGKIGGTLSFMSGVLADKDKRRKMLRASLRPVFADPAVRAAISQAIDRDTLAREFSSVTCENVMKPSFVQATPGYFDFQASDAIVAFAAAHGMTVRGHTLVWHQQNPAWLERVAAVGENPAGALRDHIFGVVRHYRNDGPAPVLH